MVHEAVPDITTEELMLLRYEMTLLRRGIRSGHELKAIWNAILTLEEFIEEERVPPEAMEEFEGKIESMRKALRNATETIEKATGYKWDDERGWFYDPVTGRLVRLDPSDYLY